MAVVPDSNKLPRVSRTAPSPTNILDDDSDQEDDTGLTRSSRLPKPLIPGQIARILSSPAHDGEKGSRPDAPRASSLPPRLAKDDICDDTTKDVTGSPKFNTYDVADNYKGQYQQGMKSGISSLHSSSRNPLADDPQIRALHSQIRKDAWMVRMCYYRLPKIMKGLDIFQQSSAQILAMGKPFSDFCKDPLLKLKRHRELYDHVACENLANDLIDASRWYREVFTSFNQWSWLKTLWSLVEWAKIRDGLHKLYVSCPEGVRKLWESCTEGSDPFYPGIQETMDAVSRIFRSKRGRRLVMDLDDSDAQALIDLIDRVLNHHACPEYGLLFHSFRKLCGSRGLLPKSLTIPFNAVAISQSPTVSGGFGDVYQAKYGNRLVAVKSLRITKDDIIPAVRKSFCKEVAVWKHISHHNDYIVPFIGVCETDKSPLCMVSTWMSNGNIMTYLKQEPRADRRRLLLDITEGLNYLHSRDVVHGDLKGVNILIDDKFRACLSDFGLTSVTSNPTINVFSVTNREAGSTRWMAPELFDPETEGREHASPSRESDIYALAMVMLEVLTGFVPYHKCTEPQVLHRIMKKMPPERPKEEENFGITDELWNLMASCWQSWRERPDVASVLARYKALKTDSGDAAKKPNIVSKAVPDRQPSLLGGKASRTDSYSSNSGVANGLNPPKYDDSSRSTSYSSVSGSSQYTSDISDSDLLR